MKLLFLLLPLAVNVKAVEIINKRYGSTSSEPTWYESSEEYISAPSVTPYYVSSTPSTMVFVESEPENEVHVIEKVSPVPLRLVAKPISIESGDVISTIQPVAESYEYIPDDEVHILEKVSEIPVRVVAKPISIETARFPEVITTIATPVADSYVSEPDEEIHVLDKVSSVPLRVVAKPIVIESVSMPEVMSTTEPETEARLYVTRPITDEVSVSENETYMPTVVHLKPQHEIKWYERVNPVSTQYKLIEPEKPDEEFTSRKIMTRVETAPSTDEYQIVESTSEVPMRSLSKSTETILISKDVAKQSPPRLSRRFESTTQAQEKVNYPEIHSAVPLRSIPEQASGPVFKPTESYQQRVTYVEEEVKTPTRPDYTEHKQNYHITTPLPKFTSAEFISKPSFEETYSEKGTAVPLRLVPNQGTEAIQFKPTENYQQRVTYVEEEVKTPTRPHYTEHNQNYHITTPLPKFTSAEFISKPSLKETYAERGTAVPLRLVPNQATGTVQLKPTESHQQKVTYTNTEVTTPTRSHYTEYNQNYHVTSPLPNFSAAEFEIKMNGSPVPLRYVPPPQNETSISVEKKHERVNFAKTETPHPHHAEHIYKEFHEEKPTYRNIDVIQAEPSKVTFYESSRSDYKNPKPIEREIQLVEAASPVPVRVVSKPSLIESATVTPTTIFEPTEVIEVPSTTSLPVYKGDVIITKSSIVHQYNPSEVILQESDSPSKYHLRLDFTCEPGIQAYYSVAKNCDKFVECKDDIPKLYRCPSGQHFNRNAAWPSSPCGDPAVVSCDTSIIVTTTPPKPKPFIIALQIIGYTCETGNGYHKVEDNCEQFVQCKQFVASLYGCPAGFQYNINTPFGENPCDVPSIARCTVTQKFSAVRISERLMEFVCPSSHGYFKFANDCEKFIKCELSTPTSYKCLPGLQFNHNALWGHDPCASESVIRCRNIEVVIPPAPKFSAHLIARSQNFDCPSNHGYYRIENNCDKFIRCERFMASTYKCWSGLHFNYNAPWGDDPCASPSVARCEAIVRPSHTFSATLVSTRVVGFTCPASTGYFQSDNCEMFIQCKDLTAAWYKCNSGLQFNSKAAFGEDPCAVPAVARCVIKTTHDPAHVNLFNPAILISENIGYYTCTANGYVSIENNCEEFIQCKRNVASRYKCPAGLQFNSNAHWGENPCANESTVRCQAKTLSYVLVIKQMPNYKCPAANGYYKVEGQCEEFVECRNYVPSMYKCKHGLHFHRFVAWGAEPCASPAAAGCERQHGKTPEGPIEMDALCLRSEGRFPLDTFECSKYVVCENGFATIMPCPPGLVFNATLEACDWPVNVPSCNPNIFHGFQCPAPITVKEDGLPSDEITHFRYSDSCQNYIACQDGRPRFLSCSPGLYFDEQTSHCVDSTLVSNCKSF